MYNIMKACMPDGFRDACKAVEELPSIANKLKVESSVTALPAEFSLGYHSNKL